MERRGVDGADAWQDERGELRIDRPAPGVVRTRITGFGSLALFAPIRDAIDAEIASGVRPNVFHDWQDMTGYESSARVAMTRWYPQVRSEIASVHVSTESNLVSMGVSVVAMATGNTIVGHSEGTSFEQELAACLKPRGK